MPDLVRLYIRHVIYGCVVAAGFVALLLGLNVANLGHLVMTSPVGWVAALMLFAFNAVVFSGVQFGIAVMGMAEKEPPRGGRRAPEMLAIPVPVRVERPRS